MIGPKVEGFGDLLRAGRLSWIRFRLTNGDEVEVQFDGDPSDALSGTLTVNEAGNVWIRRPASRTTMTFAGASCACIVWGEKP